MAFLAHLSSAGFQKTEWVLDSGASCHLTGDIQNLSGVSDGTQLEIKTAGDTKLTTKSVGKTELRVKVAGQIDVVTAHEVHYTPGIAANLLSVSRIVKRGNSVIFDKNGGRVVDADGDIIATATEGNGVYRLDVEGSKSVRNSNPVYLAQSPSDLSSGIAVCLI